MPYRLSATLRTHTSDVRALSSPTNNLILSASRDSTAIAWQRSTENRFQPESVLKASSRYVNAVAYITPTPDAPKGYAVTGGQDTSVNIFSLDAPKDDPDYTLIGHTENVCALDVTPSGTIISGSWDRTAKVWKNFQLAYDLKGHQQSVWTVLAIEDDQFLTGSADKTIKLWQQHKVVQTYTGHQDAVRGLAKLPDIGFASCSNDSEIRVWTLGGDVVYTLSGHTSFVYSLSVLPNGDIVSSGEDRSVRVWQDGDCSQVIILPAISVWAVSTMPNGDIVSGSSDGVVRVFSAAEERWAPVEALKEYEDLVANQALPTQQVGDVKKSELPGPEALSQPGKKPGEVKMIRNGDIVEAHQWDSATYQWQKIGDVVDAVGQGRKQLYNGKEYDYVFDVDIQDGVPPLKLPFNVTDNPYSAAQKFLQDNDLPLTYLDQVVQFIEKNTAGVSIGTGGEEYVDPYTGASRYRGTTGSAGAGPASTYSDPFTGASRYVSNAPAPSSAPSSQYMDPFTGASRYSGASQQSTPPTPTLKILPVTAAVTFKQANVPAMQGKLLQFDEALRNEISTSSLAMYPEESNAIDDVFAYLTQATSAAARPSSSQLAVAHLEAIIQILERWPSSQRFPVIDLARLLTGYCPDVLSDTAIKARFLDSMFNAAEWTASWTAPLSKARETNILLVFRTLANLFQDGSEKSDLSWIDKVLSPVSQVKYEALNKTQRVALATILFNLSCLILRVNVSSTIRHQALEQAITLTSAEKLDSEAAYRHLVGLGNLAYNARKSGNAPSATQVNNIKLSIKAVAATFSEERIQNVTKEILSLI